ncbi:DNA polymerase IV [Oceanipulchritudo coccoides]|nr:DNA polymerase IV [Oceanipulchritudo coccoides]
MRKIIHIDMDCFYAAIECRDDPAVADKPVGVGGRSNRGVLTTCNYVARKFGCRSAMPVFKALELCPHLVIKPVRFDVYRRESRKIRAIFARYTDLIEPLSLDEAYLDVSHRKGYAYDLARTIREEIFRETRLTASAGIAPNKMLAKIASDWRKPNGQFAVLPEQVEAFMQDLPVRRIPGVGPRAEELFHQKGIDTCGQLQEIAINELEKWLGPSRAAELYGRCRGQDNRPVEPHRDRKSTSVERTYSQDIPTLDGCFQQLPVLLEELEGDLTRQKSPRPFNKIFVKLKFSNFQQTTRERAGISLDSEAFQELMEEAFERSPHAVRLIGVGVRFPEPDDGSQLELSFT